MEYSVEDLKKLALEEGFTNAGQLNLKALVFMPEVRQMCSADKCHAYGRNWRCPPACGTLEESAALAAQYSFGMIVQTVGQMEDEYDYETIERAGKEHADCFIKMMRKIKAMYPDVLGMGRPEHHCVYELLFIEMKQFTKISASCRLRFSVS